MSTLRELVVIGGGPAGYSAAFRAADLGMKVTLIEKAPILGGVCLREGCIPSKVLLESTAPIRSAKEAAKRGIVFSSPQIDVDQLRGAKENVIQKLAKGISHLAATRKVECITAEARFLSDNEIALSAPTEKGETTLRFKYALIATGSVPRTLSDWPSDPRIMDSSGALALNDIPQRIAVLGAGIIGLEMAYLYQTLGSEVSLIGTSAQLLTMLPPPIVRPLERKLKKGMANWYLPASVLSVSAQADGIHLTLKTNKGEEILVVDKVLQSIGRVPDSSALSLDAAGIETLPNGSIKVNDRNQTTRETIFATGDIVGQPMLAHRAVHEGKQVIELLCGVRDSIDLGTIPSVLYTDPEIAWVGLNETEATQQGLSVKLGQFPWSANARALSLGCQDGMTQIVADATTGIVLGAQIVGPHAGDLIAEIALAINAKMHFGAIADTIHPHPTLGETVGMACEDLAGTATDLPPKNR